MFVVSCSSCDFGVEQNILVWWMWWLMTQLFTISMMFFFHFLPKTWSLIYLMFFLTQNILILFMFLLHDDSCRNLFRFCTISILILVTAIVVYAHIMTIQIISSVFMVNSVNFTNITSVVLTVICMLYILVFHDMNFLMIWCFSLIFV